MNLKVTKIMILILVGALLFNKAVYIAGILAIIYIAIKIFENKVLNKKNSTK